MKKLFVWLFIVVLTLTTMVLWLTRGVPTATNQPGSTATAPVQSSGQAALGGNFLLTDQQGREVSDTQFRGKLMLVFFGFTRCPDICPLGLTAITGALEKLGTQAASVVPVFITVDPAHDTPEVLAAYMKNFHPSFTALTGSETQISAAAENYKVYHARRSVEASGDGMTKDENASGHMPAGVAYTIDHSGFIYLMGPDGNYLAHFSHDATADSIAGKIAGMLAEGKE